MFPKNPLGTLVFYSLLIFLTLQFRYNFLQCGPAGAFDNFQADSEQSVLLMAEKCDVEGYGATGGLLMQRDLHGAPYLSSWGLQGKVYCLLHNYVDCRLLCSLLCAAALLWLTHWTYSLVNMGAATALVFGSILSPWLLYAARNVYLCYWLHLLPFVASLLVTSWRARLIWIFGSVLAGALCEFDYITCVVLSAAAGSICYGEGWRRVTQSILVASCAVALAFLMTCWQSGTYLGSFWEGANAVLVAGTSRAYGHADPSRACDPTTPLMYILDNYLAIPALTLPFHLDTHYRPYLSFWAIASLLTPLTIALWDRRRWLIYFAWWSLLCSASWAILMKGHMAHHPHMNGMIFYLPGLLSIYILIGDWFSQKYTERKLICHAKTVIAKSATIKKRF